MPTLTLLISDQTIPNLLFLKEFAGDADRVLFISTAAMQRKGKVKHLLEASGIALPYEILELEDENDPASVETTLRNKIPDPQNHWVNLTCGNKIMFLVAHNFFVKGNNRLVYMPIGKDYFMDMNDTAKKHLIQTRLPVNEYLLAYGIYSVDEPDDQVSDYKHLKLMLKEYRSNEYDVNKMNENKLGETHYFFTGGWFEQYVYYRIKEQFKLKEEHIKVNVKVNNSHQQHRAGNDNEFDIIFTHNNELYVVEAKVGIGGVKKRWKNMEKILFKLGALNRNFGLRSHAWLVTLADLNESSPNFKEDTMRKLNVLGIEGIRDRNDLFRNGGNIL